MRNKLEKKSVLLLIVLIIVTLGIYVPIWFGKLKKTLDGFKTKQKANGNLINFLLVLSILEVVIIIPSVFSPSLDLVSSILNLTSSIIVLVLAFQFKNILNEYFNKIQNKNVSFSGIATFFFTIFYLQYKINRALEK